MMYTANTTRGLYDRRTEVQRKLEKASDWFYKPMTKRAQIFVPAITGAVMFVLLFTVYMIA